MFFSTYPQKFQRDGWNQQPEKAAGHPATRLLRAPRVLSLRWFHHPWNLGCWAAEIWRNLQNGYGKHRKIIFQTQCSIGRGGERVQVGFQGCKRWPKASSTRLIGGTTSIRAENGILEPKLGDILGCSNWGRKVLADHGLPAKESNGSPINRGPGRFNPPMVPNPHALRKSCPGGVPALLWSDVHVTS